MAAREVLALNISVPRIEVPQAGDTYLFPRASAFGGNLTFSTDNAYDIGASGANRPRSIYAATGFLSGAGYLSTIVLDVDASKSKMSSPADGIILFQNVGGTDFGRLQFGGTTSSFPALKRSSTVLAVRLADDSADAPLSGSYLKTASTTVASLPAAATAGAGARMFVTDANATTFNSIVAAGGANTVPVVSNGTSWLIG